MAASAPYSVFSRSVNRRPMGSSKLIEVQMQGGKVLRVSSEFGLGRKE